MLLNTTLNINFTQPICHENDSLATLHRYASSVRCFVVQQLSKLLQKKCEQNLQASGSITLEVPIEDVGPSGIHIVGLIGLIGRFNRLATPKLSSSVWDVKGNIIYENNLFKKKHVFVERFLRMCLFKILPTFWCLPCPKRSLFGTFASITSGWMAFLEAPRVKIFEAPRWKRTLLLGLSILKAPAMTRC